MKLISCYIENFGGLSKYSLEFCGGVTVIQEPNGFGKTTLAEFLRAMFYGFPRKAKTLDKSKRQKYTPWSGGKFGGNLVFEYEGVRYRLERTFGATPRSDTFTLIDLTTNKKSSRFSEEIGLELFRLDADSFERSTYMPQIHDNTVLTTAGIQAKLGDLVEDTNDLGNFDKAMATLKTSRSGFIPYRGSGGSVAAATAQVTRLQQELDRAEAKKEELRQCESEIAELETRRHQKEALAAKVREGISEAAEAEMRAEKRKQYADLQEQYDAVSAELARLQRQYPQGIPAQQEIESAQQTADRMSALSAHVVDLPADAEAERFLQENEARFENRIPEPEELEQAARQWDRFSALQAQRRNLGLTEAEKRQFQSLSAVFASGALEEEKLDALAGRNRQLLKYRAALDSLTLPEEDRQRMESLDRFFAAGIPTGEEIDAQAEALARCQALRQENARLAAEIPAEQKSSPVLLILALVLCAAGSALLVLHHMIVGGVVLGIGIALLAAAVLLGHARKKSSAYLLEMRQKTEEHEEKAAALQRSVWEFVSVYTRADFLGDALAEIRRSREDYLALAEKHRQLTEKRRALDAVIGEEDGSLRRALEPYFGAVADFDKAISHLRVAREQYLDLQEKYRAAEEMISQLDRQMQAVWTELSAFLGKFYEKITPEQCSARLSALRRDVDAFIRAKAQIAQRREREQTRKEELRRSREDLADFLSSFGLEPEEDVRRQLLQLRDEGRALQDARFREKQLQLRLEQFRMEHAQILENTQEPEWNAEALKQQEKQLALEISELNRLALRREQEQRELQMHIGRLPEIRDDLEFWKEKRLADQQKAKMLDDTMEFLQKARDSLTTSYLGPIRAHFADYLGRLTGIQDETVFISPDLDVQLERQGEARELAYFSAGQTDTVMLCMRLALVDALFGETKPFVILDDPFVNLDDQRTAEALALLQDLGKERQIIYMTCNSSRSL